MLKQTTQAIQADAARIASLRMELIEELNGLGPINSDGPQGDRQDAAAGRDYSEEFTPSEAEAIHRAMVREEQGRQSEERGE